MGMMFKTKIKDVIEINGDTTLSAVDNQRIKIAEAALATEMDTGRSTGSGQAAPKALRAYEWMARPALPAGNAHIFS